MGSKRREHTCPACGRTAVTVVRKGLCAGCYERTRPRERRTLATCQACGLTRRSYYRRGLCTTCYERGRRRTFRCATCARTVEAPASFAVLLTCPRCYERARVTLFACPTCGRTRRTRPEGGVCRSCAYRRRLRVATCRWCGQTRKAEYSAGDVCHACREDARLRRGGRPVARAAQPQDAWEDRMIGRIAPLRRAWLRAFLAGPHCDRAPKTRRLLLASLVRFDAYLSDETTVGPGQWTLVTLGHVEAFLDQGQRWLLEQARPFFGWLHTRRGCSPIATVLPVRRRCVRLRMLPVARLRAAYRRWTTAEASPTEALVGLLVLVQCLGSGDLRYLRLSDVLAPDRLMVGGHARSLAPPVTAALARYLAWREEMYGGPSTYLLVSTVSRLHDRPVSADWLGENILRTPVSSLRQSAIQQLVQTLGCDAMQVAASTGLSLTAVQHYMTLFSRPLLIDRDHDGRADRPAAH